MGPIRELRLIFKKLQKQLEEYREKNTALHFFNLIAKSTNQWGWVCGLEVLDKNYKLLNIRVIISMWIVTLVFLVTIYSVIIKIPLGVSEMLLTSALLGLPLQGYIKVYTYGRYYKRIQELYDLGLELYTQLKDDEIKEATRNYAFRG